LKKPNPAIVFGSFMNGLGTIHSLARAHDIPIISVDRTCVQFGSYSKYVDDKMVFTKSKQLIAGLKKIYSKYGHHLVLFPTGTDYYYRLLYEHFDDLKSFCYIPVNIDIAKRVMDKNFQHDIATTLNIPVPKSVAFSKEEFSSKVDDLELPVIIKAATRNKEDQRFRLKVLHSQKDINVFKRNLVNLNIELFQASEVIPGSSDQLYTYGSYFHYGKPKGEYVGRKITQYPPTFGIVSIAENKYNKEVQSLGKKLLSHLNFHGISQVEFKLDTRENKLKLIEVNPRSWLWVKLATECGVNLPLIQYELMTGRKVLASKPIQTDYQKYFIVSSFVFLKLLKGQYYDTGLSLKKLGKATFATLSLSDPFPGFVFWYMKILAKTRANMRMNEQFR